MMMTATTTMRTKNNYNNSLFFLVRRSYEFQKLQHSASESEAHHVFRVRAETTLELVLAKSCTSFGETRVSWKLTFCGLEPSLEEPCFIDADGVFRIDVKSGLKQARILFISYIGNNESPPI